VEIVVHSTNNLFYSKIIVKLLVVVATVSCPFHPLLIIFHLPAGDFLATVPIGGGRRVPSTGFGFQQFRQR
jgi:hypothetical protein